MNNITIGAAGLFSIDVYDGQGRRVDHRSMQPNLVTDAGLEAMLLPWALAKYGLAAAQPNRRRQM